MEPAEKTTIITEPNDALTRLYDLNKLWLSEINFLGDEIKFMTTLLDKFFTTLIKDEHVNRIQLIKMQLVSIGHVKDSIKKDIIRHQNNIEEKINKVSDKSDMFLDLEDSRVEEELIDLEKTFKKIKTDIFEMSRTLLKNEK